jgi:hypothetical protein
MNDPPFDHAKRQLEKEMLEAAEHVAHVAHVEKDPLLIILWRLNRQDRTLELIKRDLTSVASTLDDHIAREDVIKESIDEMVSTWKGSKVVGKVMTWAVGIIAAVGATIAAVKRGGP